MGRPQFGRGATGAELRLPPRPSSAACARRFVVDLCSDAGLPDHVRDTAALLTSELVTNAVVHGGTPLALTAVRPPEALRVAVRDWSPGEVSAPHAPCGQAEGGRGLAIVDALAHRWGVASTPCGKEVWFEIDTAAG